jgi:S-adenosylmethionine synthetase
MGEISTKTYVDIPKLARKTITDIGYVGSGAGFSGETCAVITSIDEQSEDIAIGVDRSREEDSLNQIGAGDQGMMFGFACNETPQYMPTPIMVAHSICRNLARVRKAKVLPFLCPDGKSQVTVEYEKDRPVRIDTVVLSTQHTADVEHGILAEEVKKHVILPVLPPDLVDGRTKFLINPTGRFVIGGPQGDSGLTGRKIIVDTYGGYARHGGGAFSGKDPTKVDRAAAYAARYVAKNVVAAGLCDRCELQIAYAIGVAEPVSIFIKVDTFGTSVISEERIIELIRKNFDLRPAAIINDLRLRRPLYKQVAAYGHFGRDDLDLPWEAIDKVSELNRG